MNECDKNRIPMKFVIEVDKDRYKYITADKISMDSIRLVLWMKGNIIASFQKWNGVWPL